MAEDTEAFHSLSFLAAQLERLNAKLDDQNQRLRKAVVLLTDVVDEILPLVVTDEEVRIRALAANRAARLAVIT